MTGEGGSYIQIAHPFSFYPDHEKTKLTFFMTLQFHIVFRIKIFIIDEKGKGVTPLADTVHQKYNTQTNNKGFTTVRKWIYEYRGFIYEYRGFIEELGLFLGPKHARLQKPVLPRRVNEKAALVIWCTEKSWEHWGWWGKWNEEITKGQMRNEKRERQYQMKRVTNQNS